MVAIFGFCKKHPQRKSPTFEPCHLCTQELTQGLIEKLPKCRCGKLGIWIEPAKNLYHTYTCDRHNVDENHVKASWVDTVRLINAHLRGKYEFDRTSIL